MTARYYVLGTKIEHRMLTYQIRKRVLRLAAGDKLLFPNQGQVTFHLAPKQPFGMEASGGRTAALGEARLHFDANTGVHHIESKQPLSPLDVTFESPEQT